MGSDRNVWEFIRKTTGYAGDYGFIMPKNLQDMTNVILV
jgi:hypothetical protein